MDDDARAVLLDLVASVERHRVFPRRQEFLVTQRARISAFDKLESSQLLRRWGDLTVWSIATLSELGPAPPFVLTERERMREALTKLQELFVQKREEKQSLAELAAWFGWSDLEQVRRVLIALVPLAIFAHFSILMNNVAEEIIVTEQVLRVDPTALFVTPEPEAATVPKQVPLATDQEALGKGAFQLFNDTFASAYREGRVVLIGLPRHGDPDARRHALLVHEYLARRGLTEPTSSPQIFRISDRGKDLAFREEEEVRRALGLRDIKLSNGVEGARAASKGVNVPGKVFIVHGQDHGVRDKIDLYLSKDLRLDTVVMQEQPHGGRTLPEKFEDIAADCAFAVFILTADDKLADPLGKPVVRARQNVILELGFFWGMFGRKRKIAVLVEAPDQMDLPSDVQGFGWIPITGDLARTKELLRKELVAAGLAKV
ncbi:MAG TPA: nucleotide-binding protein [Polyangiaceae bacterium]|nr:nucleotide-binding protein [Polyangiaceae bacterium]